MNAKRIAFPWMVLLLSVSHAFAYERLQGPTELLHWDNDRAYNGYTLFSARGTYLIDMEGQVVNTWPIGTTPRFLDNGHLLDATKDDPSGFGGFRELDWEGNIVWAYDETREGYAPHHDWVRVFNKKLGEYTTIYIANKSISHERAIAAGADPRQGPYDGAQMDAIVEVDMKGNLVWEWWFLDHVVQDDDPSWANYAGKDKTVADWPGRIDINMPGHPLKRDWLHCNSLDYNAELGQIVTNSVHGEFYVIDHDGTFVPGDPKKSIEVAASPAGDFLYRFGDPARYGQGEPPRILENWNVATSGHKQMGGAHDVQWIKPGLPGAGHFLIFNNGQYLFDRTSQSSILEINGFLDARGQEIARYVNPPDAGYERVEYHHDTHKPPRQISRQVVWSYQSKSPQGFFSHIGSGAQRLPNGNTLVCAMTEGHFFEVTAEGELVWEYINPVTRDGALKVLPDSLPMSNAVFRAYRYTADHPALKGKDLTPKGAITDRYAQGLDRNLSPQRPQGDRGQGQLGGGSPQGRGAGRDGRGGGQGDRGSGDRRGGRGEGGRGPDGGRGGGPPRDGGQTRPYEVRRPAEAPTNESLQATTGAVTAAGATVVELASDFQFTEGPADDGHGNVYFTDVRASRIHRWSADGQLSLVREDSGEANGLFFDRKGNLLACEGEKGRITATDAHGNLVVLADQYNGKRFNKPNDLWIDPTGGVYFSDPAYGGAEVVQDGEHTCYVPPDRGAVIRVIDDMVRPNGLIGTPDGKMLYVTDAGAGETYRYKINSDGTLSDKTLFVSVGSDGMTIDTAGNVYLTENGVLVFDPSGKLIEQIAVPERPTNVCFTGSDRRTLFITARSRIYSIGMRAQGVSPWPATVPGLPDTGQTTGYTTTIGEDADYQARTPSYTDNGDGTVTDNATGLIWQRGDGGEMTWEKAKEYAADLALAGHDDWRLPTSHELFGLFDHGISKPALNHDFFPETDAQYWWADRERVDNSSQAWAANAGGGIGPHPKNETISAGGPYRYHARCVRDTRVVSVSPAPSAFTESKDGTVTDAATGLTWQQAELDEPVRWEEAIRHCEELTLARHDDWRLPNIKELQSITDDRQHSPAIDRTSFPRAESARYWSSTTLDRHVDQAWMTDFEYGVVGYADKSDRLYLRAVRGGASLISNPREDPSDSVRTPPQRDPRQGGMQQRPDDRPRGPGQQSPGGGQGRSRNPVVLALDANGDGEISAEEIATGPAALKKLDANGDGRVSREEMRPSDDDRRPRD